MTEVDEGLLTLDALLKSGPLVLVFFRFAKSPTCNVALPYYNLYLAPELARVGATLVGVSPHPHRLAVPAEFLIAKEPAVAPLD